MKKYESAGYALAGGCAGAVNGLLGTGGGMIFLPLLQILASPNEEELFPTSVAVMLPISLISLIMIGFPRELAPVLPFLLGSAAGGIPAGILAKKIPTVWLHRLLGVLILWGGIRSLW